MKKLNQMSNKFGINFPLDAIQFGRSIDYLDITAYLDEENRIQYKPFSKPTDAKRYLNPQSFHPRHVFKSVPMSQMNRTFDQNSQQDQLEIDLIEVKNSLIKSGYKEDVLNELEAAVRNKRNNRQLENNVNIHQPNTQENNGPQLNTPPVDNNDINDNVNNDNNTPSNIITFPLYYFDGLDEFKKLLYDLKDDFKAAIGETRIIFAIRKGKSIGNTVVKNRGLCIQPKEDALNQRCNAPGCLQCPLVATNTNILVNGKSLRVPKNLNCKTKNAIYLWECCICDKENDYFGRTIQKTHKRTNGHRKCFFNGEFEKSALSMHAKDKHPDNMSLENFRISVVKETSPRNIKREEFRMVDKYRTKILGLNRYKTLK